MAVLLFTDHHSVEKSVRYVCMCVSVSVRNEEVKVEDRTFL